MNSDIKQVICDTHVHCYDYAQLPQLLDYAWQNMAQEMGDAPFHGVLFFTNSSLDNSWQHITQLVGETVANWSLNVDETGLICAIQDGKTLYLAPARQINSCERLEFLLLGCDEIVADGMASQKIVCQFSEKYCVICPWGVGKWLGNRAQVLEHLLEKHAKQFYLGDNGGRPKFWFYVPHFKQTGAFIFNGSDPLPIANEIARVGSFGIKFLLPTSLSLQNIIAALCDSNIKKINYGKQLSLLDFIKGRIGLAKRT